jgi:putative ABC transport system substrate-binding protein
MPIVFAQTVDPVGLGVVESLARPGGNVTGFTNIEFGITGKWLELLKQIAPAITYTAVLRPIRSCRNRTMGRDSIGGTGVRCGTECRQCS